MDRVQYGFRYINRGETEEQIETGSFYLWCDIWDRYRAEELDILHVDGSADNWTTSYVVYDKVRD